MTPQEKAMELFKKAQDCQWVDAEYGMDDTTAKNVVLFAVDEILNNNCGSTTDYGVNAEDNELYIDEYYWFEVKQEIEKL